MDLSQKIYQRNMDGMSQQQKSLELAEQHGFHVETALVA
jgi:hypothetical protein